MNKGLLYTTVSIVAAIAFVAIASLVLPHFEKDTPFHTYYEVHNTDISCDGDRPENLTDIEVVLDFNFDTTYSLTSKDRYPTIDVTGQTSIILFAKNNPVATHSYSKALNNAYEATAVFVYEDSVVVTTWHFKGASKVAIEAIYGMVYIDLNLSTSVDYSVSTESKSGYFVVTYPNEGSYGPNVDQRFFVTTTVPGTFGLTPPEGKVFVFWADDPVPSKASETYLPNESITSSLTLYAIWGYTIRSVDERIDGDYTEKLSDITIDLWNGTVTDAASKIGLTKSYSSSSMVFTPSADCIKMTRCTYQKTGNRTIVDVEYRFPDAVVELTFYFDDFRSVRVVESEVDLSVTVFLVLDSNVSFSSWCESNHVYG